MIKPKDKKPKKGCNKNLSNVSVRLSFGISLRLTTSLATPLVKLSRFSFIILLNSWASLSSKRSVSNLLKFSPVDSLNALTFSSNSGG
jgi:hypothetical protein